MRISHEYKFIYFSNPKTGSSTLRKLLQPYSEELHLKGTLKRTPQNPFYPHISPKETRTIFKRFGWDFNAYHKFVFVRNPWARLVSLYEHIQRESEAYIDFSDWLYSIQASGLGAANEEDEWRRWKKYGAYSIEHFIKDNEGNILVDKVIRLEDIDAVLLPYLKSLGLPKVGRLKIKHHNQRTNFKKHYSQYYTADSRDYIAQMYRYDIINYDYSFEQKD